MNSHASDQPFIFFAVSSCCDPPRICRDGEAALSFIAVAFTFMQIAWATGLWVGCVQLMTQVAWDVWLSGLLNLVTRSFASGFGLAVALVYLQSDHVPNYCSPESLWSRFPFVGFVATAVASFLFAIDMWARRRMQGENYPCLLPDLLSVGGAPENVEEDAVADETHLDSLVYFDCSRVKQERLAALYSIILAVVLGASQTPCTMGPMVASLTLRQFFQGLAALARATSPTQVNTPARLRLQHLVCSFCMMPVGVAAGIGISTSLGKDDGSAVIVETLLQWTAAFLLAFESCEDLLHTHNCLCKTIPWKHKPKIRILYYGAVMLGAGIMPLIASMGRERICNFIVTLFLVDISGITAP